MYIAIYGRDIAPIHYSRLATILKILSNRGAEFSYYTGFYSILSKNETIPDGTQFSSGEDLPDDIDIFLSFGGDGTLLNAPLYIKERTIPVAGVNFGRLGFLTTVKATDDENIWIDNLISRRYSIEQRTLIELSTSDIPESIYPKAINEITLQRKDSQMLGIEISIGLHTMPLYWADGVLISTPTGSTAYSLSVGGPIVMPEAKVLIISPLAPHNLNIRPLVIPDTSEIKIRLLSRSKSALVSIDNRSFEHDIEKELTIKKSHNSLNYFSLGSKGFIAALNEKLLWGEDKRNEG